MTSSKQVSSLSIHGTCSCACAYGKFVNFSCNTKLPLRNDLSWSRIAIVVFECGRKKTFFHFRKAGNRLSSWRCYPRCASTVTASFSFFQLTQMDRLPWASQRRACKPSPWYPKIRWSRLFILFSTGIFVLVQNPHLSVNFNLFRVVYVENTKDTRKIEVRGENKCKREKNNVKKGVGRNFGISRRG